METNSFLPMRSKQFLLGDQTLKETRKTILKTEPVRVRGIEQLHNDTPT